MSKRKFHIVLGTTIWLIALAGVVVLFFSGMHARHLSPVRHVRVSISGSKGTHFVSEDYIQNLIRSGAATDLGNSPHRVNLRAVEALLRKEAWVKDANLYIDNNQTIHADITERSPVARIFHADGTSRYMDESGYLLPLSQTVREDLPVFTGLVFHPATAKLSTDTAMPLVYLSNLLQKDIFWQKQAAQIEVLPGQRFIMFPSVGAHQIILGDTSRMKDKLDRLRIFYKQVFAKQSPYKYSILNASFGNQVVAVLRSDTQAVTSDGRVALMLMNELVEKEKRDAEAMAIENTADRGRVVKDVDDSERRLKQVNQLKTVTENSKSNYKTGGNKPKALLPASIKNN
jgi:cell division protein FtsQ